MMTLIKQLSLSLLIAVGMFAQSADNTKTNQRDQKGGLTADDQGASKSDRDMARKIRQSIHEDKGLSTYAQNAKIIVQDGRVTLKGPVRTQAEKDTIEKLAAAAAGESNVTNQLDIVPASR